MGITVYNSI